MSGQFRTLVMFSYLCLYLLHPPTWPSYSFLYLFCICCSLLFVFVFVLFCTCRTLQLGPPIPFGCSGDLALTNWSSGRKSSRTGGREGERGAKKTGKGEGEEKWIRAVKRLLGHPDECFLSWIRKKLESGKKIFNNTLAEDTRAWPFWRGVYFWTRWC